MSMMIRRAAVAALIVGWAGPAAAQPLETPSGAVCRTLDGVGAPATLYAPGDPLVVTGENFRPGEHVSVEFTQETSLELGSVAADRTGALSTWSVDAAIPTAARSGAAGITLTGAGHTATCPIHVLTTSAAAPVPPGHSATYLALWGVAVVTFGSFLSIVSVRRWRASKLAAVVSAPSVEELAWEWDSRASVEDETDPAHSVEDEVEEAGPAEIDEPAADDPEPTFRWEAEEEARVSSTVARLLAETRGWSSR